MIVTKKRTLIASIVLIIALLLVGGTMAYFNADDTAHNVIATKELDIDLIEWADMDKTVPFPEEGITGALPGDSIIKIPEVRNTNLSDAWIRVAVKKSITLSGAGIPDTSLIKLNINTEYWEEQDGYYYYKGKLEAGETTEPLFTTVTLDKSMDDMYRDCTISIDIIAQGVQTANNGTSALAAEGWPV